MTTPLMTWNIKQARWFIKYRKKQYTIGPTKLGTAPTKEASVRAANEWWKNKREKLDELAAAQATKPDPRLVLERDYASATGDLEAAAVYQRMIDAGEADDHGVSPNWTVQMEKVAVVARLKKNDPDATITANVKDFLESKRRSITLKEVSAARWDSLRQGLEQFRDWIGGERPLDSITEDALVKYRNHLIGRIEVGEIGTFTARDRLDTVRQFARDRWKLRKLTERPRNLEDKQLIIKVRLGKVRTFTADEIKTLLAEASERTRLYLLLMLNCGYLQTDIAELTPDDLRNGYIEKKRHKTENHPNVPTVKYKLWKETLELLEKHKSTTDPEHLLTTETGTPLKQSRIKTNGRMHKTSAITEAWKRLRKKTKIDKPVKLIRKTSADLLDKHPEYGRYAIHFLGQSPRGVALKFYLTPPTQAHFDAAIAWLGQQFGVGV